MGPPFFKAISERPVILISECRSTLGEGAITTYFIKFDAAGRAGLELTTSWMLSESTTTRLRQPVALQVDTDILLEDYVYHFTDIFTIFCNSNTIKYET
jgi:hypothetical protein